MNGYVSCGDTFSFIVVRYMSIETCLYIHVQHSGSVKHGNNMDICVC